MQKLARLLAGAAVLATVALSAPGTALAQTGEAEAREAEAQEALRVYETFPPGRTWTSDKFDKKNLDGQVLFDLRDNVDGGLCMRPHEVPSRTPLSDRVCWNDGETGLKTLAAGVRPGTDFFIEVQKRGNGSDNDWGGLLYY